MNKERMQIFSRTLNVAFLLFKSMRFHLKFQMEYFLTRLSEIIISETAKVSYEKREIALSKFCTLNLICIEFHSYFLFIVIYWQNVWCDYGKFLDYLLNYLLIMTVTYIAQICMKRQLNCYLK